MVIEDPSDHAIWFRMILIIIPVQSIFFLKKDDFTDKERLKYKNVL